MPNRAEKLFPLPNSLIQGLTTTTPANLNKLTSVEMRTLLALFSLIRPSAGTTMTIPFADLLATIGYKKKSKRISPKQRDAVKKALEKLKTLKYCPYEPRKGTTTNQVKIFTVLLILQPNTVQHDDGKTKKHKATIKIQPHEALLRELRKEKETIKSTLLPASIFEAMAMGSPRSLRLRLVVLRQVRPEFNRDLTSLLTDLGYYDGSHLSRALTKLEADLKELERQKLIASSSMNPDQSRITIAKTTREETRLSQLQEARKVPRNGTWFSAKRHVDFRQTARKFPQNGTRLSVPEF